MVGDYEWVTLGDHLEAHTILTDLTRQTGKLWRTHSRNMAWGLLIGSKANLLPDLGEEVAYALQSELDGCGGKDPTPSSVFHVFHQISLVLRFTDRLGPKNCISDNPARGGSGHWSRVCGTRIEPQRGMDLHIIQLYDRHLPRRRKTARVQSFHATPGCASGGTRQRPVGCWSL